MARTSSSSAQLQLFEAQDVAQAWNVRVSRRARRLSVRVYPGGRVEVVVPPGASPVTVERFVGTHRHWIHERIADLSAVSGMAAEVRPSEIRLPGIDRTYVVEYRAAGAAVSVTPGLGNALIVAGAIDNEQRVARALRQWLMDLAHSELDRQVRELATRHDFEFRRIQIRRQRTRWGSCSAKGTISLNVCGVFQEPAVLRYLLIHELSHTRHMNHSRRFWSLVESLEPDYRRLDRELLQGWQRVPGWMFS
ncbi:MAG TPA: SprT family zinc-dependent metalloprotease [Povalibacter sp.]|nr:SprT family zinc-dependent metalloprotease [Povalibacter sp.]